MVPFPGDLVDPDPAQPVETVHGGVDVGLDPGDDRADRAPRHPHQFGDCGLGALHRQPGDGVVEGPGVTGTVTGPRDRHHRRAVYPAADAWGVGLEPHLLGPEVKGPPSPATLAPVIERGASPAPSTPLGLAAMHPDRHDDNLVAVHRHVLDRRPRQANQPSP